MPVNLPLLSNHLIGKPRSEASGAVKQAFEIPYETKPERGGEKYFISTSCGSIANREQIKYINITNDALLR